MAHYPVSVLNPQQTSQTCNRTHITVTACALLPSSWSKILVPLHQSAEHITQDFNQQHASENLKCHVSSIALYEDSYNVPCCPGMCDVDKLKSDYMQVG
jgi:hypothetical protein